MYISFKKIGCLCNFTNYKKGSCNLIKPQGKLVKVIICILTPFELTLTKRKFVYYFQKKAESFVILQPIGEVYGILSYLRGD